MATSRSIKTSEKITPLYDELVVGDGGIWQGGNQLISGKIKMLPRPFAAIHYERGEAMAGKSGKWQDLMRRRFDDRQRFLVACMVCGLLCGLLGVVFHLSIHHTFAGVWKLATSGGEGRLIAVMLIAPTLGGLICGLAIRFCAPDTVGSGIPQTKAAYYNHGGRINTMTGFWRVILGTVYVGFGNALGREGPMVHASSAIASR